MHKIAGTFFFLAGAIILMGMLTAEIFYPGTYSIAQNMISNLGSTPPPNSIIHQPSADIFDISLFLAGVLTLCGSFFLHKAHPKHVVAITIALLGLGTLGVGIFPAFHKYAHPLVALLAFVAGGISALASSRITKKPFSTIAIVLSVVNLSFLVVGVIFPHSIVPVLGAGGTERWVVYPLILWLTGFGGYLMNNRKN